MESIRYIDRITGKQEIEKVYGAAALKFIYGNDLFSKIFGTTLLHSLVKTPLFSSLYGWYQKQSLSKNKIRPFIEAFKVDTSEFQDNLESYHSFNDFFVRKLKPDARPISTNENTAIIPADGRYLFHQNIEKADGFIVKGQKFDLGTLLENESLASRYAQGAMVMARLCPSDYHRYHFPCDCIPGPTRFINGWLYSVNPIALRQDIHIFTQNKRTICELQTDRFGPVLFLEIGATNVGSINETYTPNRPYLKGAEKGFFSFGASSLILLFEPGRIVFDADLLAATAEQMEIRCLMGQSMGKAMI